jgi:hypothetical protein
MKNGLSYFQDGKSTGVVDVVEETPAETTIKPLTGAAAKKAPLNPTQTADLLANMQSMIEARQSPMALFNRGMERAAAWGSGGIQGPSAALNQLNQQQQAEEKSTFEMRQQMAAYRAAQERNKLAGQGLFGTTTETPTPTTPGAAATPGAPGAPTAPGSTGLPQGGMLSLVRDLPLRQSIATQANLGDREGALKSVQSYLADNAKDPETIKTINRAVSEGWLDPKLVPSIALTKIAGASAFVPHDVRGVGGTTQSTPLGSAQRMSPVGATPAPGGQPSAMRPGVATPAPAQPSPVSTARPTAPISAPVAAPVAAPVSAPVSAPVAARPTMQAPLVAPTLQTGFAPGSKEDLDAKAEAAKQQIAARMEQEKPIQKAAGESAVQLQSSASSAKNNITEYDMAESILKKYPKAFGIAQDGSATAAVIQLVKPGTTIPILGVVKAEGIEEAVAQKSLPKKAIEARNIFNSIATRQGVEFAKNNLTGEGRGTLSNADMKMAGVAKGLSVDSPAAANLIFTVLNRENEMMTLQRNNAWQEYQKQARADGVPADFNRFRETPEYKKAMDEKDVRVRKRFPEFFQNEPVDSTKKTAKDFFK